MKKIVYFIVLFFAIAGNADALRCGNDLVQVGDSKIDVITACGVPDQQLKSETQVRKVRRGDYRIKSIEQWIYMNLSHGEIHILEFRGDTLTDIGWKRK